MNLSSRLFILSLAGALFYGELKAQSQDSTHAAKNYFAPFSKDQAFRTWSVGVNVGMLTFSNILERNSKLDFTSPDSKFGYGLYIKKQILPIFGVQGQVFAGNLSAANSQQTTNGDPDYLHTNTSVSYAASINFIFSFANLNWHYNSAGVQPFIGAGFGMMGYKPKLTTVDATGTIFTTTALPTSTSPFVPVQIGLKVNVSSNINIELAYQLGLALSDNIDGNVYGTSNDKFSYVNAGLEFALGKRSKPQMATYSATPTRRPPAVSKIKPPKLMVDTAKPPTQVVQQNNNLLNDRLKLLSLDSDSDGVSDYFDKCPNTPRGAVVDDTGCPILDVNSKAKAINDKEKQIILNAAKSFEFGSGKSSFNKASLQSIDEFLRLLIENRLDTNYPVRVLIISGHADDFDTDMSNLSLSRDRAEAVKTYLVSKGIKPSNIVTVGYGDEKPKPTDSPNPTGKFNRRIEFSLY